MSKRYPNKPASEINPTGAAASKKRFVDGLKDGRYSFFELTACLDTSQDHKTKVSLTEKEKEYLGNMRVKSFIGFIPGWPKAVTDNVRTILNHQGIDTERHLRTYFKSAAGLETWATMCSLFSTPFKQMSRVIIAPPTGWPYSGDMAWVFAAIPEPQREAAIKQHAEYLKSVIAGSDDFQVPSGVDALKYLETPEDDGGYVEEDDLFG